MNNCINCREPITNPVCAECVANILANWLKKEKPTAIPLLRSRLESIPIADDALVDTFCIKCNQVMEICPECVSQELREWLSEDHPELTQVIPARFT